MTRLTLALAALFFTIGYACSPAAPAPNIGEPAPRVSAGVSCDERPTDGCTPSCTALPDGYAANSAPASAPPYHGTLFLDPDIITEADPTSFRGLTHRGKGVRRMYDRRVPGWVDHNAHLFDARFGSSVIVEIQVNPEFSLAEAESLANTYALAIGRIPAFLFPSLQTVWIHKGDASFGGGNNNFLIHTERAAQFIRDGILEEAFIHEGGHTSLDAQHAKAPLWRAAAAADGMVLSKHAFNNPDTEDIAETLAPWLAVRFRADRLDPNMIATLNATARNRFEYFDCQGFTMDILE